MSYVKTIVCLANSKKTGGKCVAGKEVRPSGYGGWIRPVSPRPSAEVWPSEYRYDSHSYPKLLDIIEVTLDHPAPLHHQTENHVIAAVPWVKTGELPWSELRNLRDRPSSLWINSDRTRGGLNNCISREEAATLQDSLVLIKPTDFVLEIGPDPWTGTGRKYRGRFKYKGTHYNLSVTDPAAMRAFGSHAEGDHPLADVYLCISMTEPYPADGRCHKLVAAIITDPPL